MANTEAWAPLWAKLVAFVREKVGLSLAEMVKEACGDGPGARRAINELHLALLSIRLGMLDLDQAGIANLIANHMATLLAVSADTAVLYAQYIAEPMIAIAAFMEMNAAGCFEELLGGIVNLLGSGSAGAIFSAGDAGEFAASAMLIRAYDHALEPFLQGPATQGYVGMPVSLGTYLESLMGIEVLAAAPKASRAIFDSFVSILHLIVIKREITQEALLEVLLEAL